jgi:hypothetical protein
VFIIIIIIAFVFCIPPLYDPNWNMHLLPGTPLHLLIHPNSKELKYFFSTLYHRKSFAGVFCSNYESMLSRLNISTLQSRRKHLDAFFLITKQSISPARHSHVLSVACQSQSPSVRTVSFPFLYPCTMMSHDALPLNFLPLARRPE